MAVIEEGSLIIEIPDALSFKKFDDGKSHGLSHCMKAVDFIVETKDRIIFIEIKDPPPTGKNTAKFIEELQSGRLDETLKYKYRDSFLYEWASEKINKPVYYYVIIALDKLDPASLLFRTDEFKRKLPVSFALWKRQIVHTCAVFNIESWNKAFRNKKYKIRRIEA